MLKKILISILSLIVLSIGGLFLYNNFKHKPVYGIIILDKDEKKVTDSINSQKKDIEKSIVVNGKWVENSKTLVLSTSDAQKITAFNGFQKVSGSKNNYTFSPIKQISKDEATLFSQEEAPLIKDEANKAFSSKVHEYVTLGESSAYVNSVFILPDNQYNEFTGSPISLGVLKVKSDASKALINYNNVEMNQLYDER
ncbi:hypothetical protein UAW_02251 [Enterococcus haemoperoxidus ATCC BAA-382]|uniref:Uncharacterized protein n=1 Tax=Enterococcus haemoperoxidus ATCC BAA-382 TaxID=1158608 RepID=R2SGW4_9ENTE|nr:lipoprotein BA_5634 family protein [Enterococcus haemoperoxidus]EOH94525.1 hypothetical protein UAW_02251 [Enterococcus haemoperoxidus ATCC BAA-382]EOT60570.1 hypothetical protein I583_03216 [Enterococcus haemoperoxidus ATCC BAA-382]OJG52867.1 hypothetical protein RV06_GL000899 [Enterococcus haemoperoxidus]